MSLVCHRTKFALIKNWDGERCSNCIEAANARAKIRNKEVRYFIVVGGWLARKDTKLLTTMKCRASAN
jgi:dissimilatory sulfite reductase (desulfoviridin) alpha/beta subunit